MDTKIDCDSEEYQEFVYILSVLICIYQSMPLFYIALLWRVRERLNPDIKDKQKKLEHRDKDKSLSAVAFLFEDYSCECWWFEIADLYRRITFVGILPLLGDYHRDATSAHCCRSFPRCTFGKCLPHRFHQRDRRGSSTRS